MTHPPRRQTVSDAVSMYLLPNALFSVEPVSSGVTVSVDQCTTANSAAVSFQAGLLKAWVRER